MLTHVRAFFSAVVDLKCEAEEPITTSTTHPAHPSDSRCRLPARIFYIRRWPRCKRRHSLSRQGVFASPMSCHDIDCNTTLELA